MARKATGKALKLMPIRVDEDVRAAIVKLKDGYGTINEGLRKMLLPDGSYFKLAREELARDLPNVPLPTSVVEKRARVIQSRGIRPKGDKSR